MVTRAAAVPRPIVGAQGSLHRDEVFWAYVFLAPWVIGLVVFILGPILFSLGMSTFNYTLGRESEATFVGIGNWVRAFTQDELFWPSLGRTFLYTVIVVPCSVFGALLTAMLLNERLRGTTFYRTVFFMPHLTPIGGSIAQRALFGAIHLDALIRSGWNDAALTILQADDRERPTVPWTKRSLGDLYRRVGRTEQALAAEYQAEQLARQYAQYGKGGRPT